MKKFIAIVIAATIFLAFAGCIHTPTEFSTATDSATNTFTIIIPETTETTE